jgi:(R,R)-butanediol dehydrogenase / meso-butanediol dehydrogenase / diacetyl reductase
MRAAVFRALDLPLSVEDVADPCPSANEVVIRVGRCGICGSDLHMTREPAFGVAPGTVLGHEFAGEVVEVGSGAVGLRPGDHVAVAPLRGCGYCPSCRNGEPAWCTQMSLQGGGYAQYALATDRQCLKLPATTSTEEGALVEPLAVALHGVALSGLKPGDRVLVMGAGPIGLAVAHWARRHGAAGVAVTDLNPFQSQLAVQVGATAFVQSTNDVVAQVNAALGGAPDVVFECVGRPGVLAEALEHVRPRGNIVILGLCTSADSFIPFRAVSKEIKLITSAFFNLREYQTALDTLDGGRSPARLLITDTVPLARLPVVFEKLRQRTSQCKVMVRPD